MEKDVVCGMQVDPAKAAGSSQYNGKTYYFCSKGVASGPVARELVVCNARAPGA